MTTAARLWAGVILRDLPRYLPALARGGEAHLSIRNRDERLEPAPDGSGFRCDWKFASDLHAPRVFPALGRQLMRRALAAHPIERSTSAPHDSHAPQVSFIIGHRGNARLPHLLATVETIAAQRGASVECIVVEQDEESQVASQLPSWVRTVHTPPPPRMPYCRSWGFNVGAAHARAPVLVLHDNDLLVPVDYAAQVLARFARGYEAANLKRFIFYFDRAGTEAIFASRSLPAGGTPEVVSQNLEGGSIAVTREAFDRIGGMDESFVGWGGEDNEFWERATTLKVWPWANLPMVHLWHGAQAGKYDATFPTARRYVELSQIDPRERISRLRSVRRGEASGPAGYTAEAA